MRYYHVYFSVLLTCQFFDKYQNMNMSSESLFKQHSTRRNVFFFL
ncbi:hypothetical protein EC96154_A0132 [Escherichia coli 96.154]|nr:hypothetical protein EC96154_A0132 [Escherichia coli 96.154]